MTLFIGMRTETWKLICGYEPYEISSTGRVRNKKGRILSPFRHHKYLAIHLRRDKQVTKKLFLHRLVAEAFIPNDNSGVQVNHKNHVRNDNRVENLEWVSADENMTKMFMQKNTIGLLIKHLKGLGYKISKPKV